MTLHGYAETLIVLVLCQSMYRNIFKVVPTQGTLRPGHGTDWLNEIHPTPSGFKRIAKLVWAEARKLEPGLPAM
jgi:hypothetical protein